MSAIRFLARSLLALCTALTLAGPTSAAEVIGVAPRDLMQFLRVNPQTVVLFNSPDMRCGYCGKAVDDAFASLAKNFGHGVTFASVQWVPWNKFPADLASLGLTGVPEHQIFRNGAKAGQWLGRLQDPAAFSAKVKEIFGASAAASGSDPQSAAAQPGSALTTPGAQNTPNIPGAPGTPVVLSSPVGQGDNPIMPCDRFTMIIHRANIPWHFNGADSTFCGQTALGFYPADYWGAIGAFRDRTLVGLREHGLPPALPTWGTAALPIQLDLIASGHTEAPGELWWGLLQRDRQSRHVAVGQETHTRHRMALQYSDHKAMMDFILGKTLAPFPRTPQTVYALADATPVTAKRYRGGYEGAPPLGNGSVRSAELTLATQSPIHGELRLEFEMEGFTQSVTLPLKRNVLEGEPRSVIDPSAGHQLIAGRREGGAIVDCVAPLNANGMRLRRTCSTSGPNDPGGGFDVRDAQVLFFGPGAEFAVVKYLVSGFAWVGPNGPRNDVAAEGLLVLRAR